MITITSDGERITTYKVAIDENLASFIDGKQWLDPDFPDDRDPNPEDYNAGLSGDELLSESDYYRRHVYDHFMQHMDNLTRVDESL